MCVYALHAGLHKPIAVLSVVSFDDSAHRTVYNIRITCILNYVIPRELTPTQPLRGESGEKSTFGEKLR